MIEDLDTTLSLSDWLAHPQTATFQNDLETRIAHFLFSQDPADPQFFRTLQLLAWLGTPTRPLLQRELTALNHLEILPCGLGEKAWNTTLKVGSFIAEHKWEIAAGVAIAATGVGLAVATGYGLSYAVGGIVVAGAGSIFSSDEEPPSIPHLPPLSQQEVAFLTQSRIALPKLDIPSSSELLITAEGIWANGQFYSNDSLKEHSLFAQEWATLHKGAPPEPFYPSTLPSTAIAATSPHLQEPSTETPSPTPFSPLKSHTTNELPPPISQPFTISGKKEPHRHIGWINGINNSYEESQYSGSYIQTLAGGYAVAGIYNCTHTPPVDLLECTLLNYAGYSPITANLLKTDWEAFHKANIDHPNAKLLQICHSQGAIHVRNALLDSPPEIRDRVIVVAIAPGAIVPKRLCFESYNYASEKDFIYKCQPPHHPVKIQTVEDKAILFVDKTDDQDELIILKAHPEAEGIDHNILSPTFLPPLKNVLETYEQHNGEYLPHEKGRIK